MKHYSTTSHGERYSDKCAQCGTGELKHSVFEHRSTLGANTMNIHLRQQPSQSMSSTIQWNRQNQIVMRGFPKRLQLLEPKPSVGEIVIMSYLVEFFEQQISGCLEKVMLQAEAATAGSKSPLLSQVSGALASLYVEHATRL